MKETRKRSLPVPLTEIFGLASADKGIKNLVDQLAVLEITPIKNALLLEASLFEHPHGCGIPGEYGGCQVHKPKIGHRIF